jgi:hypothetical protein
LYLTSGRNLIGVIHVTSEKSGGGSDGLGGIMFERDKDGASSGDGNPRIP